MSKDFNISPKIKLSNSLISSINNTSNTYNKDFNASIKDSNTPIKIKNRLNPRRRTFQDGYTSLVPNTTLPNLPIHIVPQSSNNIPITPISTNNTTHIGHSHHSSHITSNHNPAHNSQSPFHINNHTVGLSSHITSSNYSTPTASPFCSPREIDDKLFNPLPNSKLNNSFSKIKLASSRSSSPAPSFNTTGNETFTTSSSLNNSPSSSPIPNLMRMKMYDIIRQNPSQLLHSNLTKDNNHLNSNSLSNEQLQTQLSSFHSFYSIQPIDSSTNCSSPSPLTHSTSIFKSSIATPQPKSAKSISHENEVLIKSVDWESPIIPWNSQFIHKKTFSDNNLTEDEKFELAEKEHQELMRNYNKVK